MFAKRFAAIAPFLVLGLGAAPALSQTSMQSDPAAMGHHAAANELGVLEYCKGRGAVGSDAVDAQKSTIGRLPPSDVATEQDEALGRTGTLSAPNGQTMSLSSMASRQGVSVDGLCKTLGDGVIRSAKANQGGMTMPGMPTMPAMPSMPTMPSMPH